MEMKVRKKTRNRKRLFLLMAACLVCLVFAGCGQKASPSSVTGSFLDAIKNMDAQGIAENSDLSFDDFSVFDQGLTAMNPDMTFDEDQLAALDEFRQKMLDFDYQIGQETIDGDTATVHVVFTTYDFSPFLRSLLADFFPSILTPEEDGSYDNSNLEADLSEAFFASYEKCMANLGQKDFSFYADLTLKQTDKGWKIQGFDPDTLTALTGGLNHSAK